MPRSVPHTLCFNGCAHTTLIFGGGWIFAHLAETNVCGGREDKTAGDETVRGVER